MWLTNQQYEQTLLDLQEFRADELLYRRHYLALQAQTKYEFQRGMAQAQQLQKSNLASEQSTSLEASQAQDTFSKRKSKTGLFDEPLALPTKLAQRSTTLSPIEHFVQTLSKADLNLIEKEQMIIPEVSSRLPELISEDSYFNADELSAITVLKHNRYTPSFEHRHVFFELMYVLKGSCKQTIVGQEVECHTGDFYLIAPDTKHALSVFSDDAIVINILIRRSAFEVALLDILCGDNQLAHFFNQNLFARNINPYLLIATARNIDFSDIQDPASQVSTDSPNSTAYTGVPPDNIAQLVVAMYQESQMHRPLSEKKLNGALILLFSILLQDYSTRMYLPQRKLATDQFMAEVFAYLDANFRHATLKGLSSHLNLCEAYVSRKIKQASSQTFSSLLQDLIFAKVCALLEHSTLTGVAISDLMGFNNVEHFYRQFKKRYGITCQEYRARYAPAQTLKLKRDPLLQDTTN